MFARFQVEGVNDAGSVQRVSGRALNGERFTGDFSLARLQGHGLSSVPPVGSTGLAVFPFGDRGRGYLLGLESGGARPKGTSAGGNVIYGANGEMLILENGKARLKGVTEFVVEVSGMIFRIRPNRIDLGAMDAPFQVATSGGLSSKVFAVV